MPPAELDQGGARWSRRGRLGLGGLVLFVLGATVVWAQFRFVIHAYRIPSSAMEPTLHCARPSVGCEADTMDRVFVPRFHPFWKPRRGDIVVFEAPPDARVRCGAGGTFVKRLVGLPGETVSERKGSISIDGRPLREPYVEAGRADDRTGTWHVPARQYFVLGDNRAQSCDSREWGSVPVPTSLARSF